MSDPITEADYVVVGETRQYSFEAITKAIRFINAGSRFIITNPDATGPTPGGVVPATGSFAALITKATTMMRSCGDSSERRAAKQSGR